MILSALPAITNGLKPTVLSKYFVEQAAKDDEMAKRLWEYTQSGVGDITKDIIVVSHRVEGVEFTPEQILEVQRSLCQKLSEPISDTLEDFKFQMTATRMNAEDFADKLLADGFGGGVLTSDRLKVGMEEERFEEEALKERDALRAAGKIISDGDFEAAKNAVYGILSDTNATKSKVLEGLNEKKLKPPTFVPLIKQLSIKALRVVSGSYVGGTLNTLIGTIFTPQTINDQIIEQLTPIVYNDNPVESLSSLLQPALTDIFNREFFASKDGEQTAPTEEEFKKATAELGKLIAKAISSYLNFRLPESVKSRVDLSTYISGIIATVLFDLTKHGWENENMLFHVISALSEQLEPAKV